MPSDLWSFALDIYARPGVEKACLQAQAEGADVCLLLCGLWLETRGVAFAAERAGALQVIATPWQREVVEPLRRLRQAWRTKAQDDTAVAQWREQIKTLELQAERELLQRLEEISQAWTANNQGGPASWLEYLAGDDAKKSRDALQVLRVAASLD